MTALTLFGIFFQKPTSIGVHWTDRSVLSLFICLPAIVWDYSSQGVTVFMINIFYKDWGITVSCILLFLSFGFGSMIRFRCAVYALSSIAIGPVFYCSDSSCSSRPIFIHGCIGNSDGGSRLDGCWSMDRQSDAMVVNRGILLLIMTIDCIDVRCLVWIGGVMCYWVGVWFIVWWRWVRTSCFCINFWPIPTYYKIDSMAVPVSIFVSMVVVGYCFTIVCYCPHSIPSSYPTIHPRYLVPIHLTHQNITILICCLGCTIFIKCCLHEGCLFGQRSRLYSIHWHAVTHWLVIAPIPSFMIYHPSIPSWVYHPSLLH